MIKKNSKLILGIIIGLVISLGGVYAANEITANNVKLDKSNGKLADISGDKVQDALDYLYAKASNVGTCPEGWLCRNLQENPITISEIEIGDLIKMTPTYEGNISVNSSLTGYKVNGNGRSQSLHPQELNLWRVISKNDDGTIDVVSEYVSSSNICFSDTEGYQNFISTLNNIAKKYKNDAYTTGSRHAGYDSTKATEVLTSTAKYDESSNTRPWASSTSASTTAANEKLGAGDMGYQTDYDLIVNAYGNAKAKNVSNTSTAYWLASRYYYFESGYMFSFYGRQVSKSSGNVVDMSGCMKLYDLENKFWTLRTGCAAVRPILTLRADLQITHIYEGEGITAYYLP